MAKSATNNETMNPAPKTRNWPVLKLPALLARSRAVAAHSVGIASKKENSTIVLRFKPTAKPPTIVAAARETPGITAID
ncbi:MAG: hypothetical protein WCY42_01100 [Candidatus Omnitrophota bacterium]